MSRDVTSRSAHSNAVMATPSARRRRSPEGVNGQGVAARASGCATARSRRERERGRAIASASGLLARSRAGLRQPTDSAR